MHALVVYAHPEPSSFTGAMKDRACETLVGLGHTVQVSDLYGEQFNPVAGRHDFLTAADHKRLHYQQEQLWAAQHQGFAPDLQREQQRVQAANLMLFVYPLWWGGMPAILKGWFDRVMAYGFAYADGQRFDSGLFKGRHAMVGVSTGGTAERFSTEGVYGPVEQLLYPHRRTMLEYLGLAVAPAFVAYATPRVGASTRATYLSDWAQAVTTWVAGVPAGSGSARVAGGAGHGGAAGSTTHWASDN